MSRLRATGAQAAPNASDGPGRPPGGPLRLLSEAGVVDPEYYAVAQRVLGTQALPNPFIAAGWLPEHVRRAWSAGRVERLLAYLGSEQAWERPLGPLFDPRRLPDRFRASNHPGGPLACFLEEASEVTPLPVPDGYPGAVPTVAAARHRLVALLAALAASSPEPLVWGRVAAPLGGRVAGRCSVIVLADGATRRTIRAVKTLLREDASESTEMVVVDDRTHSGLALDVAASFLSEPRVRLVCVPAGTHPADAMNAAVRASTGEELVFLDGRCTLRAGWLPPLLARLRDGDVLGVQPLVLDEASSIFAAGMTFSGPGCMPRRALAGHPPEDGGVVDGRRFAALTRFGLTIRAADFARVGGFDSSVGQQAWDVDLCLRIGRSRPGAFAVLPSATIALSEGAAGTQTPETTPEQPFRDRWSDTLRASLVPDSLELVEQLRGRGHRSDPTSLAPPSLRWGIRVASTPGPAGDAWGDTHLALSLASALCALGQHAVVYRRGLHESVATELDDVVLGIRGLVPVRPRPGKLNILWIISHPDDVSTEELKDFDLVYAASATWAEAMTKQSGTKVRPLLQATDAASVRAAAERPLGDGTTAIFVGSARGRERKVVSDALACGLRLKVYGPGWKGLLAPDMHAATHLPNNQLLAAYRAHGLVLADHWPDMAARGFIANRLFDAVAVGARVISDFVPGMEELFGGAVRTYDDIPDFRELLGHGVRHHFPDTAELADIARRVRTEHSFEARAQRLLRDALGTKGLMQEQVDFEGDGHP